jgi:hypothetical protein
VKTFWRWAGTIFFALVFIFLTVAGIGTSLPIDHVAGCDARLDVPADALFAAIADDGSSPSWRPELRSVELVSGSGSTAVWRETYKSGQVLTLHTGLFEHRSPSVQHDSMVRDIQFDPRQGFDGSWGFEVDGSAKNGGQTFVAISEQGRIYNPVFRFLSRYVFGFTGSIKTYLTDLTRKFGETPTIWCGVGDQLRGSH